MKKSALAMALLGLLGAHAGAVELPATEITPNSQVQLDIKVISGGQVTANLSAIVPSGGSFSSEMNNAKTEYVSSEEHRNGKVKKKFDHLESGDELRLSPTVGDDGKIALVVAFSRTTIMRETPISTGYKKFVNSYVLNSGSTMSINVVDDENGQHGKVVLEVTAVTQGRG